MYYQNHIFCCTNARPEGHKKGCCASKEALKLRNYMKVKAKELGIKETRINSAGCLDRCELGPVLVVYPEGIWYHFKTTNDIDEILEMHLKKGKIVERLKLSVDQTDV